MGTLTKNHVCMEVLWLGLVVPNIEKVFVSLVRYRHQPQQVLDGFNGWLSNIAASEVAFWPAEVEVTFEDLAVDKSWTTGSVDCLPSSLLPVGTEIKVNSVLPFQNLSSARFGSSEVLQSSSITCSILSSKVTKVFRSCAIFSSTGLFEVPSGVNKFFLWRLWYLMNTFTGSIKIQSFSMKVNGLETRSWCNKIFRGFLIRSWFRIPWFELLVESNTNRFIPNRIKNLKWWFHEKKGTMTMKWDFTTTWWFQNHVLWATFNLVALIQKSSYWNQSASRIHSHLTSYQQASHHRFSVVVLSRCEVGVWLQWLAKVAILARSSWDSSWLLCHSQKESKKYQLLGLQSNVDQWKYLQSQEVCHDFAKSRSDHFHSGSTVKLDANWNNLEKWK